MHSLPRICTPAAPKAIMGWYPAAALYRCAFYAAAAMLQIYAVAVAPAARSTAAAAAAPHRGHPRERAAPRPSAGCGAARCATRIISGVLVLQEDGGCEAWCSRTVRR